MKKRIAVCLAALLLVGSTGSIESYAAEGEEAESEVLEDNVISNETDLADGSYVPETFSFSGGSGRITISCESVTVKEGWAFARIVFDSPYYEYVKAGGETWYAKVVEDTSVFEIPIALNQNNTVIGMTTRMSTAHEITYTLYVSLHAEEETDAQETPAPEIPGLVFEAEEPLPHTEYVKLYHYTHGISLLEITMREQPDGELPEKTEETTSSFIDRRQEIYEENTVKYLIIPEDTEVPAGLEKEMILIHKPADRVYAASEPILEKLSRKRDLIGCIAASGVAKEECTLDSIRASLEDGSIVYGGSWREPDYKSLLSSGCNLAIMPSDILNAKEKESVFQFLSTLDIPVLIDRSEDEKTTEGKEEWMTVYDAVFDEQ